MVKTKSDVERILEKIQSEKETAKILKNSYKKGEKGYEYFKGKELALADTETWIQENILEGK